MQKTKRTAPENKKTLAGIVSEINQFTLDNGLTVLHHEVVASPVVAVCIVYRVGSRNEAVGHTGSTHILEHLLFKDSKGFNKKNGKAITNYLEWFGALLNASTWFDRTNYYEMLPKEHIHEALALEADRMRGSLFSQADLDSEMTVVRNEYERGRNNPMELLDEHLWATAYISHPYHHPTIGWRDDIEHSTAVKLHEFYDTFYYPNNATLILIGDVSLVEAKKAVEKHFGAVATSPKPIPQMHVVEAPQEGPRSFELHRPGEVSAAAVAYKIPEGTHSDFPALYVLGQLLAGGLSSRMQKKLVDTGLAAGISLFAHPLRDPGLLSFFAQIGAHTTPQQIVTLMRKEALGTSTTELPAAKEVARAKETLLAQFAFTRDGVLSEARVLTEAVAAGDWKLAYELEGKIAAVTAADVVRVAREYLTTERETSGVFIGESPTQ